MNLEINMEKICQIIKDYFNLLFTLLIILCSILFSLVLWLLGLGRGVVPGWLAAAEWW
jgi:hypothetical protein